MKKLNILFSGINLKKSAILQVVFIFLFLVICSSCEEEKKEKEDVVAKVPVISTFYLIRHAEKDRTDETNSNPELNQYGLGRSIKWAEIFEPIDLDAIYSTNFERTAMTAAPTSVNKDIDITYYEPSDINIDSLKLKSINKNILIVGHSNTTPDIVNKLIGTDKYQQMDDFDNGSLFIVRIIDSVATDIKLNININ